MEENNLPERRASFLDYLKPNRRLLSWLHFKSQGTPHEIPSIKINSGEGPMVSSIDPSSSEDNANKEGPSISKSAPKTSILKSTTYDNSPELKNSEKKRSKSLDDLDENFSKVLIRDSHRRPILRKQISVEVQSESESLLDSKSKLSNDPNDDISMISSSRNEIGDSLSSNNNTSITPRADSSSTLEDSCYDLTTEGDTSVSVPHYKTDTLFSNSRKKESEHLGNRKKVFLEAIPQSSKLENIHKTRVTRPRLFSHPTFSTQKEIHLLHPDFCSTQTAPILNNPSSYTLKFFPTYFRRFSSFSQQGLVSSESMVSLTNRALVSFIAEENFSGFQHLLENRKVLVDDRDDTGSTALHIAATRGKTNFCRALIEHGADVNAEDNDNWTALLFASKEGQDEIVQELLDHGANIEHKDMGGWTALMWACYKGRYRCARLLMEKGADVNVYGNYNVTSLGWAAGRGCAEIVRDLLQNGAKVNTGDKYGTTPLIWASRKGYTDIVDMLLHAEANVDACGMTSWTPMIVATSGNHVDVVKLLLEHKPNVNALDKDGCSALTIACKEGFHEIAVTLINYGAYINISDRGGTSNLIHAAKGGHRSIVEALLKKHAECNNQGKDRKTALYWAVEKTHVGVVKLLLAANPDLEIATKDGDTALIKAVRNRHLELVALLLEKRAKVSAADKNGDTSLHIAMRARSKPIVELLLRNPVHSQLLYRPNRCGETPYNIDRGSPKPILPQIFGHRGLNTQEDGENLLGYSLYSSALADMLSDPTLNMPITVGLFARWGSGKSFLLSKLREEMKSFARQWFNPVFSFSIMIFIITLCFASVVGVIVGLSVQLHRLIIGGSIVLGILFLVHTFLFVVWFSSKRAKYEWSWSHRLSRKLAGYFDSLKLIFQVIFCHPPGSQFFDQVQAQPINFYFTEQAKISSTTGGENSVVQMLGSLYSCIENDYGTLPTRLYRAFKPKPLSATAAWKWRKLCCIPYCLIFLLCFYCTLIGIVVMVFSYSSMATDELHSDAYKAIMYGCILFVGLLIVANLYTLAQVGKTIIFSHRRHLQRAVSKMDALKAEGFLHSLRAEVNLITDMVKCLDGFTGKQSRMVVIIDGLDSGEQEKVLQVLDAVHILFSDAKSPFIILLAIDPHIIAKGIELNVNPLMNEANIGGHEYLRNLVHLPFFLQNAALRKVKHVKMMEGLKQKKVEDDPGPQIVLSTRRASVESAFGIAVPMERFEKPSKKTKRLGLKMSDSIASSLGSNLNKAVTGPTDLKKILLGDDYFSDINPKSMRRLMNIIHITGRLLKAFNIDFNWYHLTTWVNVTEQWPYRLSWMVVYAEHFQKDIDDSMSLKIIYDKVRPYIPISKEVDPNAALDRDDKKLDVYFGLHKSSLLVSTMYLFLPFTISLDPQLRKDITEMYQPLELIFKHPPNTVISSMSPPTPYAAQQHLRYRNGTRGNSIQMNAPIPIYPSTIYPGIPPQMWQVPVMPPYQPSCEPSILREYKNKKLSSLSVDGICDLLKSILGFSGNCSKYEDFMRMNNICGRVLLSCDLNELKQLIQMTFGDWETFRTTITALRDVERMHEFNGSNSYSEVDGGNVRINITSPEKEQGSKQGDGHEYRKKSNVLEKQVTMEEQMICGALELLNDEARDDALKGDVTPTSTLSPINSEPEPEDDPVSKVDKEETDVIYVLGNSMNLTAELPDSPVLMKRLETRVSTVDETLSTSPARSKHSGDVEIEMKRKPSSCQSPRKLRVRSQAEQKRGVIMNPKSPGMAFDSRRSINSNTHSDSSSEETEAQALIANNTSSRKISTSRSSQQYYPQSPKRRSKDESRLAKIKSMFSSQAQRSGERMTTPYPLQQETSFRNGVPVGSESSSEPVFRQYRSPTPLPPFGTDEYYEVIKSSNPSPTTSNESELGSTPEHLSSGEILFLPGPPDLPNESPFPRRHFRSSFVPFRRIDTNDSNQADAAPVLEQPPIEPIEPRTGTSHSTHSDVTSGQSTSAATTLVRSNLMNSDPGLNRPSQDITLSDIQSHMNQEYFNRRRSRRSRGESNKLQSNKGFNKDKNNGS